MNKIFNSNIDNDENTSGIRSVLSYSFIFDLFQWLIGDNNLKRRFIREFVMPSNNAKILDLGCGTGRILDFLPQDIKYMGYDANPEYISFASKRYKDRGLFYCQNGFNSSTVNTNVFDIVIAKAILHHINDGEAEKLFITAFNSLKPGGYLVTLDGAYIKDQSKIAKFIISKDRGKYIRKPEEYFNLAKSSFSKIEEFILHDAYRIPYTIFIMKCFKQ